MKKISIALLAIGLIISLVTGFDFVTRKKVVDLGKVEIFQNKNHGLSWSPLVGFGVMIVGGLMYALGKDKK